MVFGASIVGGSLRLISLAHAINNARSKWSELTLCRRRRAAGKLQTHNNNTIRRVSPRYCTETSTDTPGLAEFFVLL